MIHAAHTRRKLHLRGGQLHDTDKLFDEAVTHSLFALVALHAIVDEDVGCKYKSRDASVKRLARNAFTCCFVSGSLHMVGSVLT